MSGFAQDGSGASCVDCGIHIFDIEIGAGSGSEGFGGERGKTSHQTMGGENHQAWAVHIDERHHDQLVGSLFRFQRAQQGAAGNLTGSGDWLSGEAAFVAIVESGFVTVMTVGDDELFVAHFAADELDEAGIGNSPNTVEDVVFVGHFGGGWRAL